MHDAATVVIDSQEQLDYAKREWGLADFEPLGAMVGERPLDTPCLRSERAAHVGKNETSPFGQHAALGRGPQKGLGGGHPSAQEQLRSQPGGPMPRQAASAVQSSVVRERVAALRSVPWTQSQPLSTLQEHAQQEVSAVAEGTSRIDRSEMPDTVIDDDELSADTLAALQALARDRRERSQAQFFAITGSNGKTSTKEILQRLLQMRGQTLATIGNLNNDIGVPLTLLRLRDEDRHPAG